MGLLHTWLHEETAPNEPSLLAVYQGLPLRATEPILLTRTNETYHSCECDNTTLLSKPLFFVGIYSTWISP